MEIFTSNVAAAANGAAFLGARTPRTSLAAMARVEHALPQRPVLAVGNPDARRVASRQLPAYKQQLAQMSAELLPTVDETRKQTTNVHKTRSNAGGYGAMGPYPERERPA